MKKQPLVRYYEDTSCDFAGANVKRKTIDADYRYRRDSLFERILSAVLYRAIATPIAWLYTKIRFGERIVGRKNLRGVRCGVLFGNHTQMIADVFSPHIATFPRRCDLVVHADNVSLPVLGRITPYLGALPTPDGVRAAAHFSAAIAKTLADGRFLAVYPEAHIWPYCTEIRPFPDTSFTYPIRYGAPAFALTRVYRKGRFGAERSTLYIDGPFYPDPDLDPREARAALCRRVSDAMKARAAQSTYKKIRYIQKEDAALTPISILMCGNDRIFDGLLLAALSIAKHTARRIDLYFLTMDLTDLDARFQPMREDQCQIVEGVLKSANPESRVVRMDVGALFRRELLHSVNMGTSYTPYTMLRLLADEIPELPNKLLYLDTDVMLSGDIGELYDIDLGDADIAGAKDAFGHVLIHPRYLNAGVMLFALDKIRERGVMRACRDLCNRKKMLLVDQSALNRCSVKKMILPRRYNEQYKSRADTLIRHFSMTIKWFPYFHTETVKPWQIDLVHEKLGLTCYDDVYESYREILRSIGRSPKD